MPPSAASSDRVRREGRTIAAMVRIYCRGHHGRRRGLCPECQELLDYAAARLDRCPFGPDKATCAQCPVHCYKPAMRQRVQAVMRYAGPRMIYHHPLLALRHQWEARRSRTRSKENGCAKDRTH